MDTTHLAARTTIGTTVHDQAVQVVEGRRYFWVAFDGQRLGGPALASFDEAVKHARKYVPAHRALAHR